MTISIEVTSKTDDSEISRQQWKWTVLASMASIGGRLGDLLRRKRIYSLDLLVYAFGALWIIFAVQIWMLFVDYILIGYLLCRNVVRLAPFVCR